MLLVVNMDTPSKSTETVGRQGRQATAQERTREGSTCGRDSRSKAGKINEAEGEREGWTRSRDRRTKARKVEKAEGER